MWMTLSLTKGVRDGGVDSDLTEGKARGLRRTWYSSSSASSSMPPHSSEPFINSLRPSLLSIIRLGREPWGKPSSSANASKSSRVDWRSYQGEGLLPTTLQPINFATCLTPPWAAIACKQIKTGTQDRPAYAKKKSDLFWASDLNKFGTKRSPARQCVSLRSASLLRL